MRIVYVNGEYVVESEAKISGFDRGFMFAGSIYEVTTVYRGSLIGIDQHISRLRRSLSENRNLLETDRFGCPENSSSAD